MAIDCKSAPEEKYSSELLNAGRHKCGSLTMRASPESVNHVWDGCLRKDLQPTEVELTSSAKTSPDIILNALLLLSFFLHTRLNGSAFIVMFVMLIPATLTIRMSLPAAVVSHLWATLVGI